MKKKRKSKKPVVSSAVTPPTPAEIPAEEAAPPKRETSAAAPAAAATGAVSDVITDKIWLGSAAVVTIVAVFLRFYQLTLKPFHHDEGVNGFFLRTLYLDGTYRYDPSNYHGPTLYYITLAFTKLFGLETIPVRASVAIFGVLMVVVVLFLRRYIGNAGSLIAALFVALSPGMVFISRYFIHEIFFVFVSLTIVLSIVFFIEKRKAGPFAIFWTALLLLIGYLPSTIKLAAFLGGENPSALWAFRIAFFIVEGALAYLVLRMLLSWDNGRPIYLVLASVSVALFFATKETAFITLGTMVIACASVFVWRKLAPNGLSGSQRFRVVIGFHILLALAALYANQGLRDGYKWVFDNFMGTGRPQETFVFFSIVFLVFAAVAAWVMFLIDLRQGNDSDLEEPAALTWQSFTQGMGQRSNMIVMIAAVATAFIYISVLFFSSFFSYAEGVTKAFEAYAIWSKTGSKDHTMHGYTGYLKWGMKLESAILILSLLGTLIAMFKAKHRFAMFTALWAIGLFAAYSIIPYKTPWLALSFLLPMCIIAGYGLNELLASNNIRLRATAVALAISATAVLTYQTYQLNFVRYDDDDMSYVYAHTKRQFLDMMREIDRYAAKSGKGNEAQIEIVTPDYWPMTWYVKDYGRAYFQGRLVDANTAEMIVAKKKDQDTAVIQKYSNHYKFVGVYPLRPGVELMLLVRNDLADPTAQDLSKIPEYKSP